MKNHPIVLSLGLALLVLCSTGSASAQNRRQQVKATLTGYQEVASVSSTGSGEIRVRVDDGAIEFQLIYSGLEGDVLQSHIHLGQAGVNGGIMVFLCSNLGNGPAGTPTCPQSGEVTGVRMASDVVGPAGQGIAAGEFEEVIQAIRSGNTYANVHTSKHTGGEIRGQLRTDSDSNPH